MDINARLERLEKENRRMKKIGIVAIVFASVVFISGQAKTNKVVEANEFQLLDTSGRVRGTLAISENGETQFRLSDTTGKITALLRTNSGGAALALVNSGEATSYLGTVLSMALR